MLSMDHNCYTIKTIPTPWSLGDSSTLRSDHKIRPILPGVDAVVILTTNSANGRARVRTLMRKYGRIIATLCPRAHFQVNRSYKQCYKNNVFYPHVDLVHAYLQAFRTTKKFHNVLILEDDAIFEMTGLELAVALKRVGEFIARRQSEGKPFNTYNLGCIAHALLPCGKKLQHRRIIGFLGATQAVIWSRDARSALLRSIDIASRPSGAIKHIDDPTFVPHLEEHAFTYKRPIVTQTFPYTENSQYWTVFGVGTEGWRRRVNDAARVLVRGFFKTLQVDYRTQPGWNILYGYGLGITAFSSIVLASAGILSRAFLSLHQ